MDLELKAEQLNRSLYVLDETMVARCARSSVGKGVCPLSRGSTVKSDSFYSFQFKEMARPAGLEPAAFCLEGRRSIQTELRAHPWLVFDSTALATLIRVPVLRDFLESRHVLCCPADG